MTHIKHGRPYLATANVNVRLGPAADVQSVAIIRRGDEVAVFGSSGSWYELHLGDGTTAYVAKRYLKRVAATAE